MMNEVKLLIFDMDDTVINHGHMTKPAWIKTGEEMVKAFSLDLDGSLLGKEIGNVSESIFEDESKRPRGNYSPKELRKKIIEEALEHLKIELHEDKINYMIHKYDEIKQELVCVYDDVFDTLIELKKRGYILTLLTNGDSAFQRNKIKRFNLDPYFDKTFVSGEMGVDKPHKEVYYKIVDEFHLQPEETCMIGDNYLWEVVAPKKYGLKGIWVNRDDKYKIEDVLPDYTIQNISELLNIFK